MLKKIAKPFKGKQPDITPGQIAALLTFIATEAVSMGLIDDASEKKIVAIGGIVIAAAWKIADALLRGARAKAKGNAV